MKTFLTLAAFAAAFAAPTAASANEIAGGHWEWRNQPSYGPKSTVPLRARVWVKDEQASMANCECKEMSAQMSGCVMDPSGKGLKPSAG